MLYSFTQKRKHITAISATLFFFAHQIRDKCTPLTKELHGWPAVKCISLCPVQTIDLPFELNKELDKLDAGIINNSRRYMRK